MACLGVAAPRRGSDPDRGAGLGSRGMGCAAAQRPRPALRPGSQWSEAGTTPACTSLRAGAPSPACCRRRGRSPPASALLAPLSPDLETSAGLLEGGQGTSRGWPIGRLSGPGEMGRALCPQAVGRVRLAAGALAGVGREGRVRDGKPFGWD